jgi:hypothetical protein
MYRRTLGLTLALMSVLLVASSVQATTLLPGSTLAGPGTAFGTIAGVIVADTGTLLLPGATIPASTITGSIREVVVRTAGGTLDFIFQAFVSASSTDTISRIALAAFRSQTVDVGYATNTGALSSFTAGGTLPTSVDYSTNGRTVGFNFSPPGDLPLGGHTVILVIETDQTYFGAGQITVADGQSANLAGFAATPEPASLLLALTGLPLVGLGRWLRRRARA